MQARRQRRPGESATPAGGASRVLRQPAFQGFVFVMGLLLVSWPLLDIPARGGIVVLYVYLFEVWLALVALLVLIGRALGDGGDSPGK